MTTAVATSIVIFIELRAASELRPAAAAANSIVIFIGLRTASEPRPAAAAATDRKFSCYTSSSIQAAAAHQEGGSVAK